MKPGIGDLHDLVKDDMIFEQKLNGLKVMANISNGKIRFYSKKGRDITAQFPELESVIGIETSECHLVGEIVVSRPGQLPDISNLLKRENAVYTATIEENRRQFPATFIVEDICSLNGHSVMELPLLERKTLLDVTVSNRPNVQKISYSFDGLKLWDHILNNKLQGVIAKKTTSKYVPGKKSDDWHFIKNSNYQNCIVIGYESKNRNISYLALAGWNKGRLRFIGKVGNGINRQIRNELHERLEKLKLEQSLFPVPLHYKGFTWVAPEIVCEVEHTGLKKDGLLQFPILIGIRNDKRPENCLFEKPSRRTTREKSRLKLSA